MSVRSSPASSKLSKPMLSPDPERLERVRQGVTAALEKQPHNQILLDLAWAIEELDLYSSAIERINALVEKHTSQ